MIALGKEISNAQYRILDHRVFVNGEIEAFLNNFGNDSEVESLFKLTETVGALKYECSDKCINLGATHLDNIAVELKNLLGEVDNLVDTLQRPKQTSSTILETAAERLKRKQVFDSELKHNYQRVEDSFAVKEEEISELYSDLQLKLNIPK
ncbi:biogenesis of lysosome-related organelles complex 1 subunit 5 [Stomoxys calcitrans]|uniref:Biogenesis of lysosome-related organelles complex 1 subunit 5 n=1 Tax=Stomoxys calcitrans TaxID=35570 RepID=A0A1I8NVH6_STOCA|nr:biogenesis of lysosome-related organelles complex 1 subunit 5 [Stomoxys calcitrans]